MIEAQLVQFLVVDSKEDIFLLARDFHLEVACLRPDKKQLCLCDVIQGNALIPYFY